MGLVGPDVVLKGEDSIRKIGEEAIAQGIHFFEDVIQLMIKALLLAPDIAVKLDVLEEVLRHVDFVYLYVLFVVNQELLVGLLIALEVFDEGVVVLQGQLCGFSVLI